MGRLTLTEVTSIRAKLRDDMLRHMPMWEVLAEYISPQRIRKAPGETGSVYKARKIIKNQAGRSLRTFVSGMMNGATPRSRPWFNLTVTNKSKATSQTAKKYFSNSEKILNEHFQVSNLYRILPMAYKDVGIFSNSAFAMLPHPRYGFYFYPFAVGTYGFACDAEGNTNMFYRDFEMNVKQIVDTFGTLKPNGHIDFSKLPSYVVAHYEQKRYLEKMILSTVIVPNPLYRPGSVSIDGSHRKFQSYTFVQSTSSGLPPQVSNGFRNEASLGDGEFIKCSGYDYFPVITPRWEVQAEENYGVDGPGEIALGDIQTLQEMEKYRLEAVAKLVKPPMVGHASLRRHQASILAGGITYVDDQGAAAGFKPAFELDPKLAELIADQNEYTQAIRSAYYEDLFLMMSGQESKSHVTAAEITEKASEKMTALAPVLGQWDQDLSSKIIYNAQLILEGANRMPVKPKELEGEQLRPEYISVLAQASKVSMMNSMERLANFTSSMAQAHQDPSLMKLINAEQYIRIYADYVAVDPTLILDEDEFQAVKDGIASQQQAEQQMAMQSQAAATAKDLSAAKIGEGSMLDNMLTASDI
jgi:hypothetical protein